MKSFQAAVRPPDDEGPGDPPASVVMRDDPSDQTQAGTAPEPRPPQCHAPPSRTAMPRSISGARSVPTPPVPRRPTPTPGLQQVPGTAAMPCFIGHPLIENRHGLAVDGDLTEADEHAERR